MPRNLLSEEAVKEIKRLKGTMTAKEIGEKLGINSMSVRYYTNGGAERQRVGKVREFKTPRCKKEKDKPGFFNVDAAENWLA